MMLCGLSVVNFQQFINIVEAAIARAQYLVSLFSRNGVYTLINQLAAQATVLASQAITAATASALNVVNQQINTVFAAIDPFLRDVEAHLQDMFNRAFMSLNGLLGCTTEQQVVHTALAPLPPWPLDAFAIGLKAVLNAIVLPKLVSMLISLAAQGISAVTSGIQGAAGSVLAPVQPAFGQIGAVYPNQEIPAVQLHLIFLGDAEIDGIGTLLATGS
jgi:hypothetical protein